jgi:endoglucanase
MKFKLFLLVFVAFLALGILLMTCNTTDNSSLADVSDNPEAAPRSLPFSKGINFSMWFESYGAEGIPFTRYNEQDFIDVKSMGVDVIRLPIRMHSMTSGASNHTLDPTLLRFLDSAVGWAEKHELYIIIDNHSFDPIEPTSVDIDKILLPVWTQIAERYKNRSDYVIYEILNEPHGISDKRWGEIQGAVIDAIRKVDQKHTIIVGGTDYNSIGKLSAIPAYSDSNLIYTFHFYDPHIFTHQGANWGEPSMASLANVPFPADSKRMPRTPADLRGTWVEGALRTYARDAAPSKLYSTLNRVVTFAKARNVPVFCGEFGVYLIQSPKEDRIKWYKFVSDALDKRNIARTSWDYFGGFGIFNNERGGDFNADLNTGVVSAMGFTAPPQRTQPPEPLKSGFTIYDDYPAREFSVGYWGTGVDFSLYQTGAAEGEFAIRWGNAQQYEAFWFDFLRGGDLSILAASAAIEFMARAEKPVRFDVRFLNPESALPTGENASIPWRMRYSIDEGHLPPDGKWHAIRIPFSAMREHGAWVNAKQEWLNPQGKFSWKHISRLEFVAEDGDIKDRSIRFDSIKVVN